ncbi:MAG: hypothetical protein E7254_01815 [Lachnospiraceae bacterium]|nr:hypothetical protein [Lachnospiraceae bacterium]
MDNATNKLPKLKYDTKTSLILIGVLSVLLILPMFFKIGLLDDGMFHLGRLASLSRDITFANLKPAIYSETFYGYGYPLGIFYPDLFLYPFALLAKLGLNEYYSYLLFMIFISFASGLSFYFCIGKIYRYINIEDSEKYTLLSTILYLFFPYRIWDLLAREALGECIFFIAFPIIVLGIYEIFYNKKFSFALFFGMFAMINGHILSTAMTCFVLVVFYILNIKKIIETPKIILYTFINALLTIVTTLAIILPLLEMQSFTYMYYQTGVKTFGLIKDHALHICDNDIVSLIITIVVLIALLIAALKVGIIGKLRIATAIFIFMETDLFCWGALENAIPQINNLQFPIRMLVFAAVPLCVTFILAHKEKSFIGVFSFSLFAFGIVFLTVSQSLPIPESGFFAEYSMGKGEYMPNDFREEYIKDENFINYCDKYNVQKSGNTYTFTAIDNKVTLPLFYYKGYKVSDEKNDYSYSSDLGLISIDNVKGDSLTVTYAGTTIQKASNYISYISFILICIFAFFKRKKENI